MTYKLNFRASAFKALEKINEPNYSKIKKAIFDLVQNPRPYGYKKLEGRDGYRLRVGDYRIIYDIIDQELIIDVIDLGHIKDIYI
jgi:mRNA interferase RelE/StbE